MVDGGASGSLPSANRRRGHPSCRRPSGMIREGLGVVTRGPTKSLQLSGNPHVIRKRCVSGLPTRDPPRETVDHVQRVSARLGSADRCGGKDGLCGRGVIRIGVVAAVALAIGVAPASAEKSGGTLRIYNSTQPPSASIHEESTIATNMPFMAVFNNLVRFDPPKPRNGFDTIVPELAESWAWDTSGTKLTFKLRSGVTWHDGKPFTAKDVQCTWHRLNGKEPEYLRRNPRKIWYENLQEVTLNGDHEVTFHLSKPQPSLLPMLASGLSPVYPCHVSGRDMRTKPVGTGPFKFAEFKSHASIKLTRNPDYWKKGQPYLDAIDWRIITSRSTRVLAFVAGEFDMTFVGDITVPLMRDVTGAGADRHLQPGADQRADQHPGQSRPGALRQRAAAPGHVAVARPSGLHRHRLGRESQHRRQHDAAAGGPVGHAARDAREAAELQPGRGGAAGRGAQDHAEPRLRARPTGSS